MDLVKARKKAKEAGKEELKDTAQTVPAAPSPPSAPAAPAQTREAEAPDPAAEKPAPAPPKKPEPKPEKRTEEKKAAPPPPKEEIPADDVFMDSAFGEDLPPMSDFGDEDDSMVIAPSSPREKPEEKPAPPRSAGKSPQRSAPSPAKEAEVDPAWEEEFNRMQKAAELEERKEKNKSAKAAEKPAAKPEPARAPEKKKPMIPLKIEEDWAVAERKEPGRLDVEWEGGTAPLFPGRAGDEDDFFSLVTEELYMNEFNRAADTDIGAQLELLSFRLGQETYAVRLTSIRQIIKLVPVTMVPRAPDYVLGILSLRGTIIPVFDLRRRLKLGVTEPTRRSRIIVVAEGHFMVGMIVDEVLQVVRLPEQSLEPPPSMLASLESEYIEGIGRTQSRMLILLALEKIMVPVNGSSR